MDFGIYAGDTSKTIYLRLRDSTTGLGKTGLVFNSAGVTCSYTLPLAARAAITLITQTVTGAYDSGGFVEIDATNCKGLYRLDLPNAAIASGAFTVISIEFDGIIEESMEIPLHIRKVDATAISGDTTTADNLQVMFDGNEGFYSAYGGPRGPGVYINDAAGNTNTVNGVDGTVGNPVSTIAAGKTIADSLGIDRIYLVNDSEVTLSATMTSYEFIGIGEVTGNVINLGSQDVSMSAFYNITIEGTQGGSGRIDCVDCGLQDPGAGDTTLHIFAHQCGIVDRIQVDTSEDNVFDACFSLVAGTSAPIIQATGASGTIAVRHFSGGIEFESLSASHNLSVETDGQVIFAASCNVNATVALRGMMTITDNTAGMALLNTGAAFGPTIGSPAGASVSVDIAAIDTVVDAIKVKTDFLPSVVAGGAGGVFVAGTNAATTITTSLTTTFTGNVTGSVGSVTGAVGSVAGNVDGNVTGSVGALTSAAITDVWATDTIAEAYTTDAADGTPAQLLYEILQSLTEFAIAGTTLTVKQRDGTTATTYTLDSATVPTLRNRTT